MMENNLKEASFYFKDLNKKFHVAKVRALQDMGDTIKSKAIKGISEELRLQQKKIRANTTLKIKRNQKEPVLILRLSYQYGKISNFSSRYFLNKKPKNGPNVNIKGERKRIHSAFFRKGAFGEGLFMSESNFNRKNNFLIRAGVGVKKRVRRFFGKKEKMMELYTTVASDIGQNKDFDKKITEGAVKQFTQRFFHHFNYYVEKGFKK